MGIQWALPILEAMLQIKDAASTRGIDAKYDFAGP